MMQLLFVSALFGAAIILPLLALYWTVHDLLARK